MNSYKILIFDKDNSQTIEGSYDTDEKNQYAIFYVLRQVLYNLKPNQEVIKIEKI
jgi:hypothetical protein